MDGDASYNASSILQRAHERYVEGEYAEVVALTDALIRKNHTTMEISTKEIPESILFSLYLLRGAAFFQLGDNTSCLEATMVACRLRPDVAEPYSNIANAYKEIGDADTAIAYYKKAISIWPQFADAHGNLASLYLQMGQDDQACAHYQAALSLTPHNPYWQVDLGHILRSRGQTAQAKACFETAIGLAPTFAIAWSNLACVNKDEKDIPSAITHYKKAIECDSTLIEAYSNLGNVYKDAGLFAEAESSYLQALRVNPDDAVVLGNLAAVHLETGRASEALHLFEAALERKPDFPDCLSNMGNALKVLGRLPEALAAYHKCLQISEWTHTGGLNNAANAYKDIGDAVTAEQLYRRAILVNPSFAGARSNLGNLLKEQHKLEEALTEYEAAIASEPGFADAWSNMGNCYKDMNRFAEAIKAYETAISLRPTFSDAYGNLASVYKDMGQLENAIWYYRKCLALKPRTADAIAFCNLVHCLQTVCDWTDRLAVFDRVHQVISEQMSTGAVPAVQPHHALVYPLPAFDQLRISAHYAHAALRNVLVSGLAPYEWAPRAVASRLERRSRIRLGYVSSDLGNHPLSHLMQHVFTWYDKSLFEVFCYATSADDGSPWRKSIQSGVDHFKVVTTLPHRELAELIYRDGIDILVNLNGYTKGSRNEVFALRPAPIQIMYLGFPGSSGASYMQYFVTDKHASPPELSHLYTERLAYMPHSYFVNDHLESFPDCAAELSEVDINRQRALFGLPPKPSIVFCMFNQLYKIDPDCFATWMNILRRVPGSVLWLLRFPALGEANIRAAAKLHGIPDERLIFSDVAVKEEHIKRGRLADIFLDTQVCNAHTTGTDILWSGVPLITLPGETLASRVGASLLHAIGCPETIARDLHQYEDIAVAIATDPKTLLGLQRKLHGARFRQPLFDTRRWCADWQILLTTIVAEHLNQCRTGQDPCLPIFSRAAAAFVTGDAAMTDVPEFARLNPVSIVPAPEAMFDTGPPTDLKGLLCVKRLHHNKLMAVPGASPSAALQFSLT